jgi:UDP-N-acetylglucosamine transferase subunit ALG13
MLQKTPVTVLIAPLEWGLGHATRCIPIIKELTRQGAQVLIATRGSQKMLLKAEFPQHEFLEIPGYEIRYKRGFLLKWALIFKIPGLLKQIRLENQWLQKTLNNRKLDAVISDNRYGLYNKDIFSVFMTHQLYIQSGWGSSVKVGSWQLAVGGLVNNILLNWNYKFISKFSCCWVPDQEGILSVAGLLAHPSEMPPVPTKYIGILSRFRCLDRTPVKNSLFILLSGPEPQRTRFENIIFKELAGVTMETTVVRGLPGEEHSIPFLAAGIKIYNHLGSEDMNRLLVESEIILARSGYSTIMDLVKLKRSAILVPTPGQTEQEYLGHILHEKKWMYCVPQKNFNLEKTIQAFKKSDLKLPEMPDAPFEKIVRDFLMKIC